MSYTVQPELPASHFVYFSTLKVKSICSTETPVDFHRSARRYDVEDRRTVRRWMVLENSVLRTVC
jgi:hypothetical protein